MLGKGFVDRYLRISRAKESFLCVGVDPVTEHIRRRGVVPPQLVKERGVKDAVKEFCLNVVEATTPYAPVVKPNAQFLVYLMGFQDMKEIVDRIHAGGSLALLDAKLSDIGTTMDAGLYWIDQLGFDAVTFSPFPGYENGVDAVYRWAETRDKGIFALCRMSNPGTHDYQSRLMDGEKFYIRLARDAFNHGSNGYVVGCTASENEMGEVDVQGLPLTSITVAYYYVEYGTNLAFLSRQTENYCPEARQVLAQVRQAYPDDPTLMGIAEDSEGICKRLDAGQAPVPTITPMPTETPANP